MGKVKLRVQEKNCPKSQSLYVARVRIGTLSKSLSDFEMDALPSLHVDIKLHDTQSLRPRRSQARNKTIPTQHVSPINFPNKTLHEKF